MKRWWPRDPWLIALPALLGLAILVALAIRSVAAVLRGVGI